MSFFVVVGMGVGVDPRQQALHKALYLIPLQGATVVSINGIENRLINVGELLFICYDRCQVINCLGVVHYNISCKNIQIKLLNHMANFM